MGGAPSKIWQDLTTRDFAALDTERTVAVLPVAAVEQHGPHLPLCVDACIAQGIVDAVLRRLPPTAPVLFLPLMPIGKSNEHLAFPGTLSLTAETLIRLWTEIGESVGRAGIRRLVILNAHGGQPQIMEIVARDLRVRLGMFVVAVNYWALGSPAGLFPDTELHHGIHGGSAETSMMLHLRPDLVREAERRDFPSRAADIAARFALLRAEGVGIGFGWQIQDLNADGACGNALDADGGRGRAIIEHGAGQFIELLGEVARFPLDSLRAGPR
jgi:creatinine amidohydrolase